MKLLLLQQVNQKQYLGRVGTELSIVYCSQQCTEYNHFEERVGTYFEDKIISDEIKSNYYKKFSTITL